jgi:D-alanyl-D-alanine carboxypeptidase
MRLFFKIIVVIVAFFTNNVHASDSLGQFYDSLEKITNRSTASSTILIIHNGKNFTASSKEINDDTQFYIGSVTKHMTAYMILTTLHEKYPEESLNELLNKNLDILFPNSNLLKSIGEDWISQISLLDLLTHKSGLTDYISDYHGGLNVPGNFDQAIDSAKLLKSISFNPEKSYLYSNSNYLIVGRLLEELHHDTFDHIFEKLIKEPADMQSSFAPIKENYFSLKELSYFSHLTNNLGLHLGNKKSSFIDMANAVGAGNVISTASDLAKWGTYLTSTAPKKITDIIFDNYGLDSEGDIINLGLSTLKTDHLGDLIGWQGGQDSYASFFGYAPRSNTLIIILSNDMADQDNQSNDFNQLIESLVFWLSETE